MVSSIVASAGCVGKQSGPRKIDMQGLKINPVETIGGVLISVATSLPHDMSL
jgi:hypothetical protein